MLKIMPTLHTVQCNVGLSILCNVLFSLFTLFGLSMLCNVLFGLSTLCNVMLVSPYCHTVETLVISMAHFPHCIGYSVKEKKHLHEDHNWCSHWIHFAHSVGDYHSI